MPDPQPTNKLPDRHTSLQINEAPLGKLPG